MIPNLPRRERRSSRNSAASRFLIPAVVGYVLILILAPIGALIARLVPHGLPAILDAVAAPDFLRSFQLSLTISLGVVVIQLFLGTLTAWILERHSFRGKGLLNSMIDLPFAVSPVVVGYMLLLLFGRNSALSPVLQALDFQVAFAVPGMLLATLFVTLPFMIREMGPVIRSLDRSQELAAATLGAGRWTTFWRVVLPALRLPLLYGIVLVLARALGEFGAVLVIGGGIQGRTETTTLYIFRALEERLYVEAYTAALVLGLCSVLAVTIVDRLRHGEEGSASS